MPLLNEIWWFTRFLGEAGQTSIGSVSGSSILYPRYRKTAKGVQTAMRVARRFTSSDQDVYAEIAFKTTSSEIRNPDGSLVFQNERVGGSGKLVAGRERHPGSKVLPQARRAEAAEDGRGSRRSAFLWRSQPDQEALAEMPEG